MHRPRRWTGRRVWIGLTLIVLFTCQSLPVSAACGPDFCSVLLCDYGRAYDDDGCVICDCVYPCEDVECGADQQCEPVLVEGCDGVQCPRYRGSCTGKSTTTTKRPCAPLNCPTGAACRQGLKIVNGCPTCQCYDPCEDRNCPPGYKCQLTADDCVPGSECRDVPMPYCTLNVVTSSVPSTIHNTSTTTTSRPVDPSKSTTAAWRLTSLPSSPVTTTITSMIQTSSLLSTVLSTTDTTTPSTSASSWRTTTATDKMKSPSSSSTQTSLPVDPSTSTTAAWRLTSLPSSPVTTTIQTSSSSYAVPVTTSSTLSSSSSASSTSPASSSISSTDTTSPSTSTSSSTSWSTQSTTDSDEMKSTTASSSSTQTSTTSEIPVERLSVDGVALIDVSLSDIDNKQDFKKRIEQQISSMFGTPVDFVHVAHMSSPESIVVYFVMAPEGAQLDAVQLQAVKEWFSKDSEFIYRGIEYPWRLVNFTVNGKTFWSADDIEPESKTSTPANKPRDHVLLIVLICVLVPIGLIAFVLISVAIYKIQKYSHKEYLRAISVDSSTTNSTTLCKSDIARSISSCKLGQSDVQTTTASLAEDHKAASISFA